MLCYVVKDLLLENCTIGEVRLVGSSDRAKGRVEICINKVWASICGYRFYQSEAMVVCGQLGYQRRGVFLAVCKTCLI